ncbi:cysteinyl-tRNA synthetase [Croceibacterium mercuriale]|uniref:Cysteine--tRNA ligase n=1 Tax=Croceibacterium mercuriale TaxID=1572751 RepID=A0A0B2BXQ0_9SPHN|nr:cysteine--tRNA ligase [Croceibacterium mercuriale]KHL26219.1 cysteinyl-tRNA synthetase [Croceibacterium mercuriale]
MTELTLFNSLTRQLEPFRPVHAGEARVYSCGPTVYNYPHVGNMRAYVFADLLGRTLSWSGYRLTHVINITDVGHLTDDADAGEDKMERMAASRAQSIWDIARHYTEAYFADIRALNIRQPAHWSVATDYIEAMIEFAASIEERHCYRLDSGLYFDVSTVADYGLLARARTDEGESRIEAVSGKRNAADFAIWRTTPAGERRQMEWDSPWGRGAPGWHLECSVMSGKLLGFPFDIHTGGIDHREIHHPNEIAQNQAFCGCGGLADPVNSGARMWLHNNFLVERGGKMSKSSGEFLRVPLLVERGYHPLAYRMLCLQAHYRSELEFSWDALGAALTRLKRLVMAVAALRERAPAAGWAAWTREAVLAQDWGKLQPSMERFDAALADDLATPVALTALEDVLAAKKIDPELKLAAAAAMDSVLGLHLGTLTRGDLRVRPADASIGEEGIVALLDRRRQARGDKDFATSDALRDELAGAGVEVMDGDPLGWEWRL